ncbi:MAG: hypothetical protein RLZZ385_792 [Pseudomonadota bacterium]|jgi:phosphatidylglycerophosphatase A
MSPSSPIPSLWRNPVLLLAFGFGTGLSPRAPGTVGTALAVLIYLGLAPLHWALYLGVVLVAAAAGVWICDVSTRRLGVHDHPGIVWDEFVGYWITMFLAPDGWLWVVVGFVLFRLLDILKPWPVKWADRDVQGGLGIMLDDVLAGVMAAIALQCLSLLMPAL